MRKLGLRIFNMINYLWGYDMERINGVSLFANVGIGETYLHDEGINIKVANELLEDRCIFYKYLYPRTEVVCGDIKDKPVYRNIVNLAKKHKCEFLMATPPCQGMSSAGAKDPLDKRNLLIKYVVEFIKEVRPKYIIIENVQAMLNTFVEIDGRFFTIQDYLFSSLGPLRYHIQVKVLDAADYGTPQHRRRAIFLISSEGWWPFPEKENRITLETAIGHLPSLESGGSSDIKFHKAKNHNERHIECMRYTPTGKSAFDNEFYYPKRKDNVKVKGYGTTYKRMSWDEPAPTVTMGNGAISSQNNVHPGRRLEEVDDKGNKIIFYSDARVLTLKELFIVTGLPDDWEPYPEANENLVRKVIGECFLPQLVKRLVRNMPKR
jgi:DNA (cytosine-5)-methyltransferase 1